MLPMIRMSSWNVDGQIKVRLLSTIMNKNGEILEIL